MDDTIEIDTTDADANAAVRGVRRLRRHAQRQATPEKPDLQTTSNHLSRRTDWHRWQWQGRRGAQGVQGADAFASPGAEVD